MEKMKKILALCLVIVLGFSLLACGGNGGATETTAPADGAVADAEEETGPQFDQIGNIVEIAAGSGTQDGRIDVGTWWGRHYDSSHTSVEDDPSYGGGEKAHLMFENLKRIEREFNITWHYNNLTYDGNIESMYTSILAGAPDMDIYQLGMSTAVPAALNGFGLDLRTILPPDHDIFTDQNHFTFIDLFDGKATLFTYVDDESILANSYPLGFNLQLLQANNLESPVDLWERGEWTWDKFREYMVILTQDTTGDGRINQWGYSGYWPETLAELVMSNGGVIAGGPQEGFSSKEVGEALQFMFDMYNTWGVASPHNPDSSSAHDQMRREYRNGNIAFFPISCWIASEADYNWNGQHESPLTWDTVWVRWPVGPSGNKDTNPGKITSAGNIYMIPANVAEPELVFKIFEEYWNWYGGDLDLRKAEMSTWWYTTNAYEIELQDHNVSVMRDAGLKGVFDIWGSVNIPGFFDSIIALTTGEMTPAQIQETYKNSFQAALDVIFN